MKIVNILGSIAAAVVLFSVAAIAPAAAHVYETSNGISAIFHIKPDDRPVAKEPTKLNLKFSDQAGGFGINKYKVTLTVSAEGVAAQTVDVEPAFFGAAAEGETIVTFPEAAVYTFQAKGAPIEGTSVLPFTLNYTARVTDTATAAAATGDGTTTLLVSGFSVAVLGMAAGKAIQTGGRYRRTKA